MVKSGYTSFFGGHGWKPWGFSSIWRQIPPNQANFCLPNQMLGSLPTYKLISPFEEGGPWRRRGLMPRATQEAHYPSPLPKKKGSWGCSRCPWVCQTSYWISAAYCSQRQPTLCNSFQLGFSATVWFLAPYRVTVWKEIKLLEPWWSRVSSQVCAFCKILRLDEETFQLLPKMAGSAIQTTYFLMWELPAALLASELGAKMLTFVVFSMIGPLRH